jgi:hypothetical protein
MNIDKKKKNNVMVAKFIHMNITRCVTKQTELPIYVPIQNISSAAYGIENGWSAKTENCHYFSTVGYTLGWVDN